MKTLLMMVVGLVLAFALGILVASNFGGENVMLRTSDVDGSTHQTRLWIQDLGQTEWLRASSPESRWYQRLVERPMVEVERKGLWKRYRAVPTPHRTGEVASAIARKYGWADWLTGLLRDPEVAVAIRLVPVDEGVRGRR
jgi:hypothetical protein